MLDTIDGTITVYEWDMPEEKTEISKDSPDFWRAYPKFSVSALFEMWKQKYIALKWIPTPSEDGEGGKISAKACTSAEEMEELRAIYREHGWPNNFRREECQTALLEHDERVGRKLLGDE